MARSAGRRSGVAGTSPAPQNLVPQRESVTSLLLWAAGQINLEALSAGACVRSSDLNIFSEEPRSTEAELKNGHGARVCTTHNCRLGLAIYSPPMGP